MKIVHLPVLAKEVVEQLAPTLKSDGILVDATIGSAGHSSAIAEQFTINNLQLTIIGIDQDESILEIAKKNLEKYPNKKTFVHGNFRDIQEIFKENSIDQANVILADIGVSSYQFDTGERGFSFQKDAPLDMRMDQSQDLTAELIIKTWNESKIADCLKEYGEEPFAYKIAKAIVQDRQMINSTTDLADLIARIVPHHRGKIHSATKTFQALRIAVNDEIEALKDFLKDAPNLLTKNGRLAIISFHSLEDRLVKQQFNQLAAEGNFNLITKHPIVASQEEVDQNPRSRSARLRIIERI